jgi:hypothetical protein
MTSETPKGRLPFEPRQKKKKPLKKPPVAVEQSPAQKTKPANSAFDKNNAQLSAIPKSVSNRMVTRMVVFAGIPTALGLLSFVVFYWIVKNQIFKVPTVAVLLVSMGLFGLGVLGLSYGILSASWDENRPGSWLGWQDFKTNFGRMTSAWGAAREEAKETKGQ